MFHDLEDTDSESGNTVEISSKGKTIDPAEWGNVDISEHELNAEAQRVRFAELTRDNERMERPARVQGV